MNIELQKTLILLSIIVIFFCLYISNIFDKNGSRENNYYLFGILLFCCILALIQVSKIKNWKKENKTDYYLVYNSYLIFTYVLFLYFTYIVITRSKMECFMILSNKLDYCAGKLSDSIKQEGGLRDTVNFGFETYKYIWKKMLFL